MTDHANVLQRAARRHGWTEAPSNTLDYYTLKFTRPEPGGRQSVVRVRITHRIVDVQIEIGGLRQSFTMPTPRRVEEILATPVPAPVRYRDLEPEDFTARLTDAVQRWRAAPPRDLAGAVKAGDSMADAAEFFLRDLKGDT